MSDVREYLSAALRAMDAATAQIQHAYQVLYEMGGDGAPVATVLDVAWASQLGPDAAYSNSDCGPACVTMWLRWLQRPVSVDQVSEATGLPRGYKYTVPGNLVAAAKAFGLRIRRVLNVSITALQESIAAGAPVIVLVHYPSLPAAVRYDAKFSGGHWVLVVGYTDGGDVIYHDPYWPDTRGQRVRVTRADFERAMRECSIDGNTPNQALMLDATQAGA